jgi:hypothetical protein
MTQSFRKIERIYNQQKNSLIAAPASFPAALLFPINLTSGAIVDLGVIAVPARRRQNSDSVYCLSAFINWEMTCPAAPSVATAQVAFEFVRNDVVVFRAMDTLAFTRPCETEGAVTTFNAITLQHLDTGCVCSNLSESIFKVRVNNIVFDSLETTAAVGAVNFQIEELRCVV